MFPSVPLARSFVIVGPMESAFNLKILEMLHKKNTNCALMSRESYLEQIRLIKEAKRKVTGKTPNDYQKLKRYDVITIGDEERLVHPITPTNPTMRHYLHTEELFGAIHQVHLEVGHCGRDRMKIELGARYKNITKEAISMYLKLCRECQKNYCGFESGS